MGRPEFRAARGRGRGRCWGGDGDGGGDGSEDENKENDYELWIRPGLPKLGVGRSGRGWIRGAGRIRFGRALAVGRLGTVPAILSC
eukprot:CAMPEP_0168327602 /NCGR_PEP_ID=MMETSP0213-20121227/5988_1 /TAXON_ID=151035 /ORGANISM="Euplotes harpa, Strain FSP1.4" /LENGTH=85 /DNA_ID=CAMNT_0008330523 /DNA_START=645 /DNA_END=902 /DNA_ORIENTATION=-